jgi:transposase
MAKQFIHYDVKNNIEYASVYTPRRVDGKKVNDPEYLGRVVDKTKGIYRNRSRGEFKYSLETGYGDIETPQSVIREERLILDFGDAYILREAIRMCNFYDILYKLLPIQADTLMSLLAYKLLGRSANCHAEDWWEGSYTRMLYPQAKLRSQRISEFYQELGEENIYRSFFSSYLYMVCQSKRAGVLIDSTGMPNDIHFPLTAINTHYGVTSNETRLLMVVDRKSHMPLYFRYNAGNIVDVTTLRSTIAELEAFGIDVDYAIVDAGYCSENNMRDLYGDNKEGKKTIPFLTRLSSNLTIYKNLVARHAKDLTKSKYMLMQRDRLLSVKRVETDLWGHIGYAYVCMDHARREDEILKYAKATLETTDVSHEEMDIAIESKGTFVLISSEKIEPKEVMPLYYTRQVVEQVFDTSKNSTDLLPLRVHSEEAFRGHLLLNFIVTVIHLSINQMLKDSCYNTDSAFIIMRNQKCKVFDDCILPKETTKKMNDIYKLLNLKPILKIDRCGKK